MRSSTVFRERAVAATLLLAATLAVAAQEPASSAPVFEVASFKPVAPPSGALEFSEARTQELQQGSLPRGWLPLSGNKLTLRHWPLSGLIAAAFSLRTGEILGPSWLPQLRFDVDARIPENDPRAAVNEMLQSLLAERFGLRQHTEKREGPGYALVVAKQGPHLEPSTPS